MSRTLCVVAAVVCIVAATAVADVVSGPKVGVKMAALKVAVTHGADAGKELDLAERLKEKPVILAFVQAERWDRPMARYLRTLDQELVKQRPDVRLVAVWITDEVEKAKDYQPRAQQSLKLEQTDWCVSLSDKNGPADWSINSDAHLTTVLVSGSQIDATFGYRSVNETDVPDVLKKLKPK